VTYSGFSFTFAGIISFISLVIIIHELGRIILVYRNYYNVPRRYVVQTACSLYLTRTVFLRSQLTGNFCERNSQCARLCAGVIPDATPDDRNYLCAVASGRYLRCSSLPRISINGKQGLRAVHKYNYSIPVSASSLADSPCTTQLSKGNSTYTPSNI
jgi:hypothetical protein